MSNNIMMMSIPELDKAKKRLTALQEAWDILNSLRPKNETYKQSELHRDNVLYTAQHIVQEEIDKIESEIILIEKEYGEE